MTHAGRLVELSGVVPREGASPRRDPPGIHSAAEPQPNL